MLCSECGEREATHVSEVTKGKRTAVLGVVCSTYCNMVLMERVNRWPKTYIDGAFKRLDEYQSLFTSTKKEAV